MGQQFELLAHLRRSKMQNLQRHMAAIKQLPRQVATWRRQAEEGMPLALHQSQIEALARFLEKLQNLLKQRWAELEQAQEAEFPREAHQVQLLIMRVYRAWRFYKERFDQRASADDVYKRFMAVADEVAWSAYTVSTDRAHELDIITDRQRFKQPPLLHLFEKASPVIYARAHRAVIPNMPVHVIDLPYYETSTAWSLLALHHEVAHGLLEDLNVDAANTVARYAVQADLITPRLDHWFRWAEEIVADCFALLLGGPPFVRELMDVLMGMGPGDPQRSNAPHPPPYLRIPLICTFLSTLEEKRPLPAGQAKDDAVDHTYKGLAARYEQTWKALYPQVSVSTFQPYLDEREAVLTLLMDTELEQLADHSLREVGSFTPGNYRLAKEVAEDYLVYGDTPGERIPPRLVIPAARMAFDQLSAGDAEPDSLSARLEELHENTLQTVETNFAEEGTRALYPGEEEFLDGLAEAFAREPSPIELLEEDVL